MKKINQQTPDRVTYTLARKRPGDIQYSSDMESITFATDVMAGETAAEATERVKAFVQKQFDTQAVVPATRSVPADEIFPVRKSMDEKPSLPSSFFFNPANPRHQSMAQAHFDIAKIPTERRQKWIERFLVGQRLDQIGKIIHAEKVLWKKSGGDMPNVRMIDGSDVDQRHKWRR